MKKQFVVAISVLAILVLGGVGYLVWRGNIFANNITPQNIGGDRDKHGCLGPAGYAFDAEVGACIRAFEMTPDIKRAAQLAVSKVGASYALTVVSFNSYEEVGAYDITLEQGLERNQETVVIKKWQVVSVDVVNLNTQRAIQDILAKKYNKSLSEVNIKVVKEVQGFAAGSVLFGQGGVGEGGVWLAVNKDNVWQVVFDGNGSVDCNKMRQQYGFPDTILKPNFCN